MDLCSDAIKAVDMTHATRELVIRIARTRQTEDPSTRGFYRAHKGWPCTCGCTVLFHVRCFSAIRLWALRDGKRIWSLDALCTLLAVRCHARDIREHIGKAGENSAMDTEQQIAWTNPPAPFGHPCVGRMKA